MLLEIKVVKYNCKAILVAAVDWNIHSGVNEFISGTSDGGSYVVRNLTKFKKTYSTGAFCLILLAKGFGCDSYFCVNKFEVVRNSRCTQVNWKAAMSHRI